MPLRDNQRLGAIADATVDSINSYPGDQLDVVHVLLCAAVQTMVRRGFDDDAIQELVRIVLDGLERN